MTTLTIPAAPKVQKLSFGIVDPTRVFEAGDTGSIQTFEISAAHWLASYQLPPVKDADQVADWKVFFAQLRGRGGRFFGYDPALRAPRGTAGGTPLVNGASQTGRSLITDAWSAGATMKKGDYAAWNTSNGRELKMLTADATADGSGNMTIAFEPAIRKSPANNEALILTDASCVMMLMDDERRWEVDEALFYGFAFRAMEALAPV